jgi:hypothetical protein
VPDAYHHAMSSSRKWGGLPEDYLKIHQWFDGSKAIVCDFRHRALRHHAEGIDLAIQLFGPVIKISTGRSIPTRWIGEQHIQEDFGHKPPLHLFAHGRQLAQASPGSEPLHLPRLRASANPGLDLEFN